MLSGWRVGQDGIVAGEPFNARWHEPGPKTVLGQRYGEGAEALHAVLRDLARHPATAHFVSTKLARHFVADEPPPALVDRLAAVYLRSDGQLAELYRELIGDDRAWVAAPAKLKTPEELVVSTARVLAIGDRMFEAAANGGPGYAAQSSPASASASRRRRRLRAGATAPRTGSAPMRSGSGSSGRRASPSAPAAASMRAASPRRASARCSASRRRARSSAPATARRRSPCCCSRLNSSAAEGAAIS